MLSYCDGYKLAHAPQLVLGTNKLLSTYTPRDGKYLGVNKATYDGKVVVYGVQAVLKKLKKNWDDKFFSQPKEKVIKKYKRIFDAYLGKDEVDMQRFSDLHDLGYLPIKIRAIKEGSRIPYKVPYYTIESTKREFAWFETFLETYLSAESWKAQTVATIAYELRKLGNKYAVLTTGTTDNTEFQFHDFSYRGMANSDDAAFCGSAFLLSSCGTDTIPALEFIEDYYNTDIEKTFIGASVNATEHGTMMTGIYYEGELETIRRLITKVHPIGIVSIVSDTLDYFRVVCDYLPILKNDIMNRQKNSMGLVKTVIRADSGDQVKITAGWNFTEISDLSENGYHAITDKTEAVLYQGKYYEFKLGYRNSYGELDESVYLKREIPKREVDGTIQCLWNIFGGTVNSLGYKVLDEHIGMIYGDGINFTVAEEIFVRLKNNGFASTNIVLGAGSFLLGMCSRDTLGQAFKPVYTEINDVPYELQKDPATDDGVKKSAKGLVRVEIENGEYVLYDQQTKEQSEQGELKLLFEDGEFTSEVTFSDIRNRLWS